MIFNMTIEEKREAFIEYQKQFYKEDEAYDLIAQSDQNVAIRVGKYDEFINQNF